MSPTIAAATAAVFPPTVAFLRRAAPIRVAISFSDGLRRRKAAAPGFPTKLPKPAFPDLAIDFHGAQRGALGAKPNCRALSP
jgi:hypothetical protein